MNRLRGVRVPQFIYLSKLLFPSATKAPGPASVGSLFCLSWPDRVGNYRYDPARAFGPSRASRGDDPGSREGSFFVACCMEQMQNVISSLLIKGLDMPFLIRVILAILTLYPGAAMAALISAFTLYYAQHMNMFSAVPGDGIAQLVVIVFGLSFAAVAFIKYAKLSLDILLDRV